MKITDDMISHLENLSKIKLTDDEREKCKEDLENIIIYMDMIKDADIDNTEALSHSMPTVNVMRSDEVHKSLEREKVLKNAAKTEGGCFKVAKTF